MGFGVRQKIMLVKKLDERSRLHFIAEAGVMKAIAQVKYGGFKDFPCFLSGDWSNNASLFKDVYVGGGSFSVCYDEAIQQGGRVVSDKRYGAIDEARKVNINRAGIKLLQKLFMVVLSFDDQKAQELAASIIDWRDPDSELTIPLGSAEASYYRSLKFPYEAKDANFETIEELLLVKGMDSATFENIRDYITIYGNGRININTASRSVLLAVDFSEDMADKIIAFRRGKDKVEATVDDGLFNEPSDIAPVLSQVYSLSDDDVAKVSAIAEQYLATKSSYFSIKSRASLQNRKNNFEIACVINYNGKVLYWQEP
jgi:DNA uptake protein ComE-like DNA-binding protein